MFTASAIFLVTFIALIIDKVPRTIVAISGAVYLLAAGILDIQEAMQFVSWETIGLLFGMFALVAVLSEAGFFQFLALWVAKKLNYQPIAIFIVFPLLAAFLAAFIDSITVMLFLVSLTYEICRVVNMDPVKLVISEVCLANIGGAATLVGDPPNVILGTMLGFTFNDFATHTGPIAVVSALACIAWFYLKERKQLTIDASNTLKRQETKHIQSGKDVDAVTAMNPSDQIKDWQLLRLGLVGFVSAIFLLITHTFVEQAIGFKITVAEAALIPAIAVILLGGRKTHSIIHHIDIDVLLFFIALFVLIGGLEKTGVIEYLAERMIALSGGNPYAMLVFLLFGAGYASGIVDNVPLALTMGVILKDIAQASNLLPLPIMVWTLALGVDIGGNITPIGASANVVAYTNMERFGSKVGWGRWMRYSFLATSMVMIICFIAVVIKYQIGWY